MTALSIDLDLSRWELREQLAYREKVGVNPQYAYAQIVDAFTGGEENALLNIPAEYLLGFAWVTQRREKESASWDELVDGTNYVDLLDAFSAAFKPIVDKVIADAEKASDRPTKAGKGKKRAPARTTDSSPTPES